MCNAPIYAAPWMFSHFITPSSLFAAVDMHRKAYSIPEERHKGLCNTRTHKVLPAYERMRSVYAAHSMHIESRKRNTCISKRRLTAKVPWVGGRR